MRDKSQTFENGVDDAGLSVSGRRVTRYQVDSRAASSCSDKDLDHMEVLESHLRDDGCRLMEASCEECGSKGSAGEDRCRHRGSDPSPK